MYTTKTVNFYIVSERNYSSSNWTVPTLPPSISKDNISTRRTRSTTFGDDYLFGNKGRMRRLGPRKYLCTDCGNTFALKASLTRHQSLECTREMALDSKPKTTKQLKTSAKTIKPLIPKVMKTSAPKFILPKVSLPKVMASKSSIKSDSDQRLSFKSKSESKKKKHMCKRCGRDYAFYTSLWRHLHYECGMEPKFTCEICRLRFAQKSNLERHMRNMHSSANITLP